MEFLRMTAAEYREKVLGVKKNFTTAKESKYHAKKVERNGEVYDSKKEMQRAIKLEQMLKAGVISQLSRQVSFSLIEPFTYEGKKIRGTVWVADFVYFDCDKERWVAEDVKSPMTRKLPDYRLKKKLFMLKYPDWHFEEHV